MGCHMSRRIRQSLVGSSIGAVLASASLVVVNLAGAPGVVAAGGQGDGEMPGTLGAHLDALSKETLTLRFDGRRRRAYVRLGGGETQYLTFRLASDVHFTDGLARISTRVDLSIAGRALHLELPEVEMTPTEYRGERGVVVRLPLLRRTF